MEEERRSLVWRLLCPVALSLLIAALGGRAGAVLIDDLESLDGWSVVTSDGARLDVVRDIGYRGRGMRLDFDFEAAAAT